MTALAQYPLSDIRLALCRFRLPLYSRCLWRLGDMDDRIRVLGLWQAIFGDPAPPGLASFDLLKEFVWRVHEELFHVDLLEMDGYQNMVWSVDYDDPDWEAPGSVLDYPIPLLGYGIPWEMAGLDECNPAVAPLLAVLDEQLEDRAEMMGFDPTCFLESVEHWWAGRDRMPAVWGLEQQGVDGVRALQRALRLLPAPLDALADLVDCILRDANSVFLNTVSGGYQCEYSEDFCIWDYADNWNVDTIRRYAESFAAVRPAIERVDAYEQWYDEEPAAGARVLAVLERLVAGGWHIESDQILYHDEAHTVGAQHTATHREGGTNDPTG